MVSSGSGSQTGLYLLIISVDKQVGAGTDLERIWEDVTGLVSIKVFFFFVKIFFDVNHF